MVGYTGGSNPFPTYQSVCSGDGHTEAIQIKYDPNEVSYKDLLNKFFESCSPCPSKTQYKSAVWYENEEQKRLAEQAIASQGKLAQQFVDLAPVRTWHNAEGYHQKYLTKMRRGF